MEAFKIEESNLTPKISLDGDSGQLEFAGKSIPENSLEFYQPVYDWLDAYVKDPREKTVVTVKLDYFNTSSSKCILDILKRIDKIDEQGFDVLIKWYYDEDDEDVPAVTKPKLDASGSAGAPVAKVKANIGADVKKTQ